MKHEISGLHVGFGSCFSVLIGLLMLVLPTACGSAKPYSIETSSPSSDIPVFQGSIEITSPSEGTLFRNNVVKVEGNVSRSASDVKVNSQDAYVSDGKFFAYVELVEGQNKVEATARLGNTDVSSSTNVSFKPPLAVFIYGFRNVSRILESSQVIIEVTGAVSKPEASVTLNGEPVVVEADGQFSKQITVSLSLRSLIAGASLGDDKDTYDMAVFDSGGYLGIPPFGGSAPNFPVIDFPRGATVNRGNAVILEWTYQPKHNIRDPKQFDLFATGAPGIVPTVGNIPLPEGLKVSFLPDSFTAYPNCVYNLSIVITASQDVKPGTYEIQAHLPNTGPTIFVEVK
ncbi:MAG: hypothetical protein TUN42_08335 [Dehalogenimonas sp.]